MLKVGLTGGIGVGKTTVSDFFQQLGVPVIDTDVISHELVSSDSQALKEIVYAFGEEVLTEDSNLDRKHLGKIVFADASKRKALEAILHPRIKNTVLDEIQNLSAPYCIVVVPLLIETDFIKLVDRILVVDAPDKQRQSWIKKRRGLSTDEISAVISAQTNRKERFAVADYVISNDGTVTDLEKKVSDLHHQILNEIK